MSSGYPPALARFLKAARWPPPADPTVALRMHAALQFFDKHLPHWRGAAADRNDPFHRKHGANPWGYQIGGRITKLTSAMQAIRFTDPVTPVWLEKGMPLWRYGTRNEDHDGPPRGPWYTNPHVPAAALALPPDQTVPYYYEVTADTDALLSSAGDLMVDWKMNLPAGAKARAGVDYHYRAGGGPQYLIPAPRRVLREV